MLQHQRYFSLFLHRFDLVFTTNPTEADFAVRNGPFEALATRSNVVANVILVVGQLCRREALTYRKGKIINSWQRATLIAQLLSSPSVGTLTIRIILTT